MMVRLFSFLSFLLLINNSVLAQNVSNNLNNNGNVTVKLGATLPLSGDVATYGNLIKDGIELALDDLRAEGFKVSVVYEDVPLPTQVALSAIQKLINVDRINGLVGNFWNGAIPIMANELMRNKVIAFHTAAADDVILKSGNLIFSTNSRVRDEAYHVAEYAYNTLKARTANVLYIETNFGDNYQTHFVKRFEELGGKVLTVDGTKLNESDLRPQMLRIGTKKADVLFAAYFGTSLGLVLKQAGQAKIGQQILSVYEAEDPSVLDVAGDYANGLQFFVSEAGQTDEAYMKYRDKFVAKYKSEPRILGSNAYDATQILVRSLVECKLDTDCAKQKIHSVKNYNGASGKFSIDEDGAATKQFVLKGVENKKYVYPSKK